jgi:hypothetical protein
VPGHHAGGVDGAAVGRLVAKIPARRCPEAVDRLVGIYAREHDRGEPMAAFFRRVDPARIKGALADLERITDADALPLDYVDLGEEQEFAPVVMDGECSA